MKITEDEVLYIAGLARLSLNQKQVRRYAADLEEILTYVDQLNELDTENVEPMAQVIYPGSETATLREDASRPSLDREEVLRSAPLSGAGHFKAPRVIER